MLFPGSFLGLQLGAAALLSHVKELPGHWKFRYLIHLVTEISLVLVRNGTLWKTQGTSLRNNYMLWILNFILKPGCGFDIPDVTYKDAFQKAAGGHSDSHLSHLEAEH